MKAGTRVRVKVFPCSRTGFDGEYGTVVNLAVPPYQVAVEIDGYKPSVGNDWDGGNAVCFMLNEIEEVPVLKLRSGLNWERRIDSDTENDVRGTR